jgi:hypothetical protein
MGNETQHITYEGADRDAWVCLCGNEPIWDGFYACDTEGNETSPDIGSNWQNLYVCLRCGRIIKADDLAVIARNLNPKVLS